MIVKGTLQEGSTNLGYSEKINLKKVPTRLSFQGLSLCLGKEKLAKYTYFGATGHCFNPSSLNFYFSDQLYHAVKLNIAS